MRRILEYVFYRLLALTLPLLPRRAAVWLGRRCGGAFYWLSPKTRRVGLENLRRVFPKRTDHRRLLRRSLKTQAVALLDALWSARLTPERARRYLEFDQAQLAHFESTINRGRGGVIATAHFGSWEMFNLAAGALGLPRATFIARRINNPWIDKHLTRMRERTGNRLVYRQEALPACIGALRRGEVAASVIDMAIRPEQGAIFADFMGTPACTSAALPLLASRRGAPLWFVLCLPIQGGNRYRLAAEEIEVRAGGNRDEELRRLVGELNKALERHIRANPEGWLWGYKRWKWRPGEVGYEHYPSYSLWVNKLW